MSATLADCSINIAERPSPTIEVMSAVATQRPAGRGGKSQLDVVVGS